MINYKTWSTSKSGDLKNWILQRFNSPSQDSIFKPPPTQKYTLIKSMILYTN